MACGTDSGHGNLASGDIVTRYVDYLNETINIAEESLEARITANDLVSEARVPLAYSIRPELQNLMTGFHRWNLRAAYEEALEKKKEESDD
jgi:hypothetical protein|tara:strand:+ start:1355 stop:1627 length:273 start_codon:yes stop_codon:yes gene_type:complete